MNRIVDVKNIRIGEGIPKVCVSMIGETLEELKKEAHILKEAPLDIVEWRVDFYNEVTDIVKVKEALKVIRNLLYDIPILFTFRTKEEGGAREISKEDYRKLNNDIAEEKLVDLIDIELFTGDDVVKDIISKCHKNGIKTIVSNHDFQKTPKKEEMINRMKKMQSLGADIAKIAVMPKRSADVLELLYATNDMTKDYAEIPIITMSMAGIGSVTRISGEIFGSSVTFGCARKASAPGQINVSELNSILNTLHESLNKFKYK